MANGEKRFRGGSASRSLRVLLYIGRHRPPRPQNCGERLIDHILKTRHRVAGVILVEGDPMHAQARRLGLHVITLPKEFDASQRRQMARLKGDADYRARYGQWLLAVEALDADLGVTFYTSWVPARLFKIPRLGFINFHPAPLPELRGNEPEAFMVLEGRRIVWGTVHEVTTRFDQGRIVARTARLRVPAGAVPPTLWYKLTELAFDAVVRALNQLAVPVPRLEEQREAGASSATRKDLVREALIRWDKDDLETIERRLRTFSGQDIGIRLKARVESDVYTVHDLEIIEGVFGARVGEVLGRYAGGGHFRGQPVVCARGGAVVLRLGGVLAAEHLYAGHDEPLQPIPPFPRRRRRIRALRIR